MKAALIVLGVLTLQFGLAALSGKVIRRRCSNPEWQYPSTESREIATVLPDQERRGDNGVALTPRLAEHAVFRLGAPERIPTPRRPSRTS